MEIFKFGLGVRFDVMEGEEQATPKQLWEEVFSVLTTSDVQGMHVYGGMASSEEFASKEPCYICAFTNGKLKDMRRVYRKLEEDAGVNMYLAATHPFLQSNALEKINSLTFYGRIQRDGTLHGGDEDLFGVHVCKKRGKRRPVGKGIVFLLAPDAFSNVFTSKQVIRRLTLAARKHFTGVRVLPLPIANGGAGTVDALLSACNGTGRTVQIQGPQGEKTQARYAVLRGSTAVIEMPGVFVKNDEAQDCGCSSFGIGELIRRAMDEGLKEIIIGLPQNCIDDGGLGCLRALGAKLLDNEGNELSGAAKDLANVAKIDRELLHSRLRDTKFILMTDDDIQPNAGLTGITQLLDRTGGTDTQTISISAPAVDFVATLMALLHAERKSAIDSLLYAAEFDRRLKNVSLVVTGTGSLDARSLKPGSVVETIVSRCSKHKVPVAVIAGQVGPGGETLLDICECSVISAVDAPISLKDATEKAVVLFDNAANRMFRFIRLGREIERVSARKSKK